MCQSRGPGAAGGRGGGPARLLQSRVASGPGWLWQSEVGAGWLLGAALPLRGLQVLEPRAGGRGGGLWCYPTYQM